MLCLWRRHALIMETTRPRVVRVARSDCGNYACYMILIAFLHPCLLIVTC